MTIAERRARFDRARRSLGWSIAQTALQIEQPVKTLETWLYDNRRNMPILAVLLIESRLVIAQQASPTPGQRRAVKEARAETTRETVRNMIGQGMSYADIGKQIGVTRSRVCQIAIKMGINALVKSRVSHPQAVDIVRNGGTYQTAATAVGLSYKTVARACKAAGVRVPPRGRPARRGL